MPKEHDTIAFGRGSSTNIVSELIAMNPDIKVAVIENEKVSGICLTRRCILSKMLLYPAKLIHETKRTETFHIYPTINKVDLSALLQEIRHEVDSESMMIEEKHDILVGYYRYEDTAIGSAMKVKDYFVKVILEKDSYKILGAHIIGPDASILIQEIINLMYTQDQSTISLFTAMHIYPTLPEVVQRAFYHLHEPEVGEKHYTH